MKTILYSLFIRLIKIKELWAKIRNKQWKVQSLIFFFLLLVAGVLIDCSVPRYTTNLYDVLEEEIGNEHKELSSYRCTAGAHRGASVAYLENTLAALEAAIKTPIMLLLNLMCSTLRISKLLSFTINGCSAYLES